MTRGKDPAVPANPPASGVKEYVVEDVQLSDVATSMTKEDRRAVDQQALSSAYANSGRIVPSLEIYDRVAAEFSRR